MEFGRDVRMVDTVNQLGNDTFPRFEAVDTTGADLVTCIRQLNPSIEQLECFVFDSEYVMGSVDAAYLDHLKGICSDNMKTKVTVVNGLASAQATGDPGGGSGHWLWGRGGGHGTRLGLHNTWKLS
ncbi:hypothetical protein EDB85DRAFT_2189606 [Lactarius pseudohatsudake]|nr:hypothetical protein EDB85DRAFT_2189606 [Lactarius pseudohatsudake]